MAQATQTTSAPDSGETLRLTRSFAAPREVVFRAFTDPEIFKKWWGPKGVNCQVAKCDVRPGGRYHLEMTTPEGNTHVLDGEYREVVAPERLVYTWTWGHGDFGGIESLVTLEFIDSGNNTTELRLTHERLPGERARELHGQGWSGCFDCLEALLHEGISP